MPPKKPSITPRSTPSTPSSLPRNHSRYESFQDLVPSPSPTNRGRNRLFSLSNNAASSPWAFRNPSSPSPPLSAGLGTERKKKTMNAWDMILLTIGLAGAQLIWTVEMAYGTPYLLSLGMTKEGTSLVWIAGPMSGLLGQPIIGALSDSSPPAYRRRFYILCSTALIICSVLTIAFAPVIAAFICALRGLGDWDPSGKEAVGAWTRGLAIAGFWFLDFGMNGCEACLRALILDQTPSKLVPLSTAYHSRMVQLGNLLGYSVGYLDLAGFKLFGFLGGGGQFRRLSFISCLAVISGVGITCYTQKEGQQDKSDAELQEEEERERNQGFSFTLVLKGVVDGIKDLPPEVRRVCFTQLFAWTGFFPFLFYCTTYVSQTLFLSLPPSAPPPTPDTATRLGSLALLLYSLVALATGMILPTLLERGRNGGWARHVTLRNIWTGGLFWFGCCMASTFWVSTVRGAMSVVACAGVSWGIASWVPFALVMESIQASAQPSKPSGLLPSSTSVDSSPASTPPTTPHPLHSHGSPPFRAPTNTNERTALLLFNVPSFNTFDSADDSGIQRREREREVTNESEVERVELPETIANGEVPLGARQKGRGGTILGIHNLAIVIPQFGVSLVAAAIFGILDKGEDGGRNGGLGGRPDVVWVLRYGGLAAFCGAIVSRWLLPPRSEKRDSKARKKAAEAILERVKTVGDGEEDEAEPAER